MATKFYVDSQGNYLGGFDGALPPPGSVQVPAPPVDGRDKWDAQNGVFVAHVPVVIVPVETVVLRIITAGLLINLQTALAQNAAARLAFGIAANTGGFDQANVDVRNLITAIGADPAVILAKVS